MSAGNNSGRFSRELTNQLGNKLTFFCIFGEDRRKVRGYSKVRVLIILKASNSSSEVHHSLSSPACHTGTVRGVGEVS